MLKSKLLLLVFIFIICCNQADAQLLKRSKKIPPDTVISLLRSNPMSPSYQVYVFADGLVIFQKGAYGSTKGLVRTRIGQNKVRQLISEFERINYFSLDDMMDFCYGVTDLSLAATSITINGKSKSNFHHYGCNENSDVLRRLMNFEGRIDNILGTKQWLR